MDALYLLLADRMNNSYSALMNIFDNLYLLLLKLADFLYSLIFYLKDNYYLVFFLAIIIILCIVLLRLIREICKIRRDRAECFVKNSSLRYQQCQELNAEYSEHFVEYGQTYDHWVDVNTRQKVDTFNFQQELSYLLSTSSYVDIDYIENCISSNQHWYRMYRAVYDKLPGWQTKEQFRAISGKKVHMSYKKYSAAEQKLEIPMLQPELSFQVVITASYTSPKGYSHYEQSMIFSLQDCENCLSNMVLMEEERNYRDEERRKMTPALRYEVLKRDGFRCTICGRSSADGVKLHVDHIKPVSKGGRTELSNLRTLCQDCNLGKSARWDPDGIN